MSLTQKSFELLRQRERLLEDVRIFGAKPLNVRQGPISVFDRTQDDLRTKQGVDAIDRLASVEAELRDLGIETGEML